MKKIIAGALFIFLSVGVFVISAPVKSFAEPASDYIRDQKPVISMEQAIEIFEKTYPGVKFEEVTYQRRGGKPTYFLAGKDQDYNRYKMEIDAIDGTIIFHKKTGNYGNDYYYGRGGGCRYY